MSATFNLQTNKREDLSVRLKTHDIKRAKNETKKLEKEGKKMEERLMELKLAMNREKEERERQGGGFWKTGQTGTLNNYAEEVLAKKKSKSASSGKSKIKILKDKPLDLPERNNQPGTMAFIAQKGSVTPRDKPRGPKCGQCEERGAAVTCMQCTEDYCAGCFAAFHLKGNLKKHRSVPLGAAPRQCFASPRPTPGQTSSSYDFYDEEGPEPMQQPPSSRRHDRNSPEGASGTYENSLLNGTYNEAEQAASFQDALGAWRGTKGGASENQSNDKKIKTPRPVSRVMTPTVNVDTSTGMQDNSQEIEINFSNNISYAERLLLKKHRRTDVDALFTPRDGSSSVQNTPRHSGRESARKTPATYRERSNVSMNMEDFDDFDDEERVNFQALFNAVRSTDINKSMYPDPDTISIVEVELQESQSEKQLERSMNYKVQEEGGMEKWNTELQNESSTQSFDVKPPSSSKSGRRKSGRKSAKLSQSSESLRQSVDNDQPSVRSSITTEKESTQKQGSGENSRVLGAKLNDVKNSLQREKTKSSVRFESEVTVEESDRLKPQESKLKSSKIDQQLPPRSDSRAKSSQKSRPQSGSRTASRQAQSRSNSRQGSRPSSRANSRIGSSRASSRAENPGLLTKGPSDALQQIARMTPTSQPYKGMESFFMVGVEPTPQGEEERTLTPSGHRDKDGKMKVSYQLYNMAPRSWKPDFSIADSVPTDALEGEVADDERASSVMAYQAYSEMLVSDITERLISRFGDLPLEEDELSDQSGRSLGEEYRTFTPRDSVSSSLQGSPILSGRGTPVQFSKSAITTMPTPRRSVQDPSSQTPRQSARSRAQTPKASSTQKSVRTPRRSQTFHENMERPVSRAIVMEGTDLSIFDNMGIKDNRDNDDEECLDQLEWELASQTGRLTADGMVSRMEVNEELSDDSLNTSMESARSMSRLGQDQGYDINNKLRKDELEDENVLYHETDDEGDVRNLM